MYELGTQFIYGGFLFGIAGIVAWGFSWMFKTSTRRLWQFIGLCCLVAVFGSILRVNDPDYDAKHEIYLEQEEQNQPS